MITKIDAAESQLNTAIRLFFENRDHLSSYTLAIASREITDDLIESQYNVLYRRELVRVGDPLKVRLSYREHYRDFIKPEFYPDALKLARKRQNFLKHADCDPDGIMKDLTAKELALAILFAVSNFHLLAQRLTAQMAVFSAWFRAHLYRSVLSDTRNKLDTFVSRANRGTDEQPITMDMLEKSIFAHFLYREPTAESMASEEFRRDDELNNVVELCTMLVEGGLHSWSPKAPVDDQNRLRLQRMFSSKSMMAWSELLWDAVCGRLDIDDTDERLRVFYRALSGNELERVRKTVQRLYEWQRWIAPKDDQIDRVLSDKKSAVKDWFRADGFTTGYLMGATG